MCSSYDQPFVRCIKSIIIMIIEHYTIVQLNQKQKQNTRPNEIRSKIEKKNIYMYTNYLRTKHIKTQMYLPIIYTLYYLIYGCNL